MRALVTGLAAGIVTMAVAGRLEAQPAPSPDYQKAKTLYTDANAEMASGRYAEAARDYSAAYDITQDAVLFFKIGTANEKAGNCAAALVYYARYIREAKPDAKFLELVNARITACGGDPKHLGEPTPVAAPPPPPPPPTPVAGSGSAATPPPAPAAAVTLTNDTPQTHVGGHNGAWLMVGGAVAFITVGAVLAYSASSSEQDIRDLYVGIGGVPPTYDATTAQRYQDLINEGHRYQYLSWASFGVAAGFAVGAAAWFIHDRNQEALAIMPSVTPQGASVSATLHF